MGNLPLLPYLSKEEIVLFLQVQHAQGNIIYFPLPGLRDYIVISPSYVIELPFLNGSMALAFFDPMTVVHISFLLLHSEIPLFQDLPDSLH
jgi:hypothetical protein